MGPEDFIPLSIIFDGAWPVPLQDFKQPMKGSHLLRRSGHALAARAAHSKAALVGDVLSW